MSVEVPLDIVGSANFGRYDKISIENTYNMIISDNCLVPYAGYSSAITFDKSGRGREIFRSIPFNHLIVVIDSIIYSVSVSLGFSRIGNLYTESGEVYITENGIDQIVIVDGSNHVYVFNHVNGTFTTLDTDGVGGNPLFRANYITFQDGYFIVSDESSNQWRLSSPNDGTSWPSDPSNIGVLQTKGDKPKAVIEFKRQLFVMGSTISEIWHDVGNTLFPYQRDNSILINYGVLSAETIASEFDLLVWLGQNRSAGPTILVSNGGDPKPIATDGIEFLLDNLSNPENSSGFLFQENGHILYQITFRSDNISLTYDFNTNKFFTLTDENLDSHIAKRASFFNKKNFFISYKNSMLYEFGTKFKSYDGKAIPRIRITKPYRRPNSERFLIENINITMEQGSTSDPQKILLSLSKDGGISFGNIFSKNLNTLGDRRNKVNFWKLGSCNDVTIKFQFWSDPTGSDNLESRDIFSDRFVIINGMLKVNA